MLKCIMADPEWKSLDFIGYGSKSLPKACAKYGITELEKDWTDVQHADLEILVR